MNSVLRPHLTTDVNLPMPCEEKKKTFLQAVVLFGLTSQVLFTEPCFRCPQRPQHKQRLEEQPRQPCLIGI